MANHLESQNQKLSQKDVKTNAHMLRRADDLEPIGVIDIGSNSVRLVVYEGQSRVPVPFYNEKVLSGLGRGLSESGKISDEALESAYKALKRFRILIDRMAITQLDIIATAAVREASNGQDFLREAENICGVKAHILSGKQEAYYSAYGIVSSIWRPDGLACDLGGGSLELIDLVAHESGMNKLGEGQTLPLGGIRLQDDSNEDIDIAYKIAKKILQKSKVLPLAKNRTLYLIGGTWRSLARLYFGEIHYPLRVIHGFVVNAKQMINFCDDVMSDPLQEFDNIDLVSRNRRSLLPFGTAVLRAMLEISGAKNVVLSAFGLREGLLYAKLDPAVQISDPLLTACDHFAKRQSRSYEHAQELPFWTNALFRVLHFDETAEEARLRHAACLLCDVNWRSHPDYRASQSLAVISHAAFVGLSHEDRVFIGLANYYRYEKDYESDFLQALMRLIDDESQYRAQILGLALRLAHALSAAMPGLLLQSSFGLEEGVLKLYLPSTLEALHGERPLKRLGQLAKALNLEQYEIIILQ